MEGQFGLYRHFKGRLMTALRSRVNASSLRAHAPRILLGLLFLLPGTLKLAVPFETLAPNYSAGEAFMTSLQGTGYLFALLAVTEIVAGLLLLSNRFVPLALTLLAPIIINIFFFHLFLEPSLRGWLMTCLVVGLELLLVIRYRQVFAPFFRSKIQRSVSA